MMMNEIKIQQITCYKCRKSIPKIGEMRVARDEECPFCQAELRCCRMCRFYDPSVYNDCHETNAERLTEKEKANFCDYFELNERVGLEKTKEELFSKAESLFKKL